jgi:hypothetical protein
MALAGDDIRLIKLADHCSNVASLPSSWSIERSSAYLDWSERVADACSGASRALDDEYRRRLARARAEVTRRG